MHFDLAIIETGNGGDLQLVANDLAIVNGIENMPYLGMFGGNQEQSKEQNLDWWGNNVLMPGNKSTQLNSTVERIINTTPLTSAGRLTIENAIKKDLEFLNDFATIKVTVSVVDTDRIDVNILVNQNLSNQKIITIKFKKPASGDWFILDFNDDFLI